MKFQIARTYARKCFYPGDGDVIRAVRQLYARHFHRAPNISPFSLPTPKCGGAKLCAFDLSLVSLFEIETHEIRDRGVLPITRRAIN